MQISEQNKLQKILKAENGKSVRRNRALYKKAVSWIETFESGKRWMNKLRKSMTKNRYARAFFKYCAETGYNPDELLTLKMEGLKAVGTPQEFHAEDLLEKYLEKCKSKLGGKLRIKSAVISFYKRNRRPLAPDTAEKFRQKLKEGIGITT